MVKSPGLYTEGIGYARTGFGTGSILNDGVRSSQNSQTDGQSGKPFPVYFTENGGKGNADQTETAQNEDDRSNGFEYV